jgi:hypothetical protein
MSARLNTAGANCKLGYDVTEIGEGERILPAAITQQFTLGLVWKLSRAVTFC